MTQLPVALGLLDPLYILFGWIMRLLYSIISNYGVDIIIFTVFLRAIMIPLYVKNHKTTLKQQQLSDEINELKRYYGKDQQGFSMAQMELFKKHKISQMGGCLPSLLGIVFIWPIWQIISRPLHYIMGVTGEQIKNTADMLLAKGFITPAEMGSIARSDVAFLRALNNNGSALTEAVTQGWVRADQLINLNFLGLDLGLTPTFKPSLLFGAQKAVWLPMLIIPIVAVLTSFLVSSVSNWTNPMILHKKRMKELAKLNPAREVVDDQAEKMTKNMMLMMPVFTLFTVFTMPAAMGIYWILGNIMMIVQSYVLYFLYTKPVMHELKKQDKLENLVPERSK